MTTWLVFSGLFDGFHITLGIISSALVTQISSDLLFDDRSATLRDRARQGWRLALYLGWLMWQVVLSNLHLLRLALAPGGLAEVKPRVVSFRTTLKTDFEKFLLANSITLTPGTITVKILGDEFLVHAVSETAASGLDGQMERRIARIFAKPGGDASPARVSEA
ncbi:MAG: Na+/H+ antiporter subunit E [Verrucomicrobiae bacterium]|nr:Na+/H+ antiporter subunit E [Verrucomicrobiae bacterium]MCP5539217.1 Na+/H+ antiporter subunit E [Akkermansiaceae bacterium]MCP5549870.1 Na+/H+ antiporter subunit E [Akkermansiaceae bacterium]